MRGLLLREVGRLEMVDVEAPSPSESEVVVDVVAAGVCGSDIHSARDGGLLRTPPVIMGHEFSGKVGNRRVAVNPIITCGENCDRCREGFDNLCQERSIIGIQRQGGFADQVAVPMRCLVDIPADVSLEAAALVEPLAVALHAVRLAEPLSGSHVGILGAGTIGLLTAYLCARQADSVFVADPDRHRLEFARAMGAVRTADELEGSFDLTFDAAGVPAARSASLSHLRPRGTTVWIGNESSESPFDAQVFVRTEQRILGSAAYTHRDFEDAAQLVSDALLDWTSQASLDDGPEIIYGLMRPTPGGPIKVLLRP